MPKKSRAKNNTNSEKEFVLFPYGAEDEILPKPLKGPPTSRVALVRRLWRRAARLRIAYEFSISFVADHVGNATSHFVLVRHGKKCNCKHAFFAHVGRAPYFEAKPLMRRGGESLLQARLSCSRRACLIHDFERLIFCIKKRRGKNALPFFGAGFESLFEPWG